MPNAYTDVDLSNLALDHIAATEAGISTFPTASSTGIENQTILRWYGASLRQALEAYNWKFARRYSGILTTHAVAAEEGVWAYRFNLPADYLKVRKINEVDVDATNNLNAIPYEISLASDDTLSIQTNVEETKLVYTADITNLALASEYFIQAFSHLLAANIAYPITRKRSIRGDQIGLWRQFLMIASAHDGNEQVEDPERDAEWIRGR